MRRAYAAVLSALMVATLASGCSGAHAPAQPSSASSDLSVAARQAVLTSYAGMWEGFAHAGQTADPTDPMLARYTTGNALQLLSQGLVQDKKLGIVARGRPLLHPQVTGLTPQTAPTSAEVSDCSDTTSFQAYSKTTGKPVDTGPSGKRLVVADLVVQDGSWKVSELMVSKVGSC